MNDSRKPENQSKEYEAKKERSTSEAIQLAENHVNWFLDLIRPLLISHFVHGYKHGIDRGTKQRT